MKIGTIEKELAACHKRCKKYGHRALFHGVHHDTHFELLIGPAVRRIERILSSKPVSEHAVRFHNLGPFVGCDAVEDVAIRAAWKQREAVVRAAWKQRDAARRAANIAFLADPVVGKIHARLFPDCTWDGKSFQVKKKEGGRGPQRKETNEKL